MNIASLAKKELLTAIDLVALPNAGAPAGADPAAQTLDMAAYDHLKSLAGQWRARSEWEFRKGDAAPTHARMLRERITPADAGS